MADSGSSVVSVNEYTGVLIRWIRVIVGVVALGAIAGALLSQVQGGRYATEAVVQIRPIVTQSDDPNLDTNRQVDPETELAVARSQRVAERALALRTAADRLGVADLSSPDVAQVASTTLVDSEDARRALENLTVSAVSDSHILTFQASSTSADDAWALAQSSAVSYLDFRREAATSGTTDSRQRLIEREAQIVAELDDLAALIGAAGDDQAEIRALAYADISKTQELTVIGTKFANLESLTVDPGVVLTDAVVPTTTEGLPRYAGTITGALLGLVAALTAVFLLDRNDDRLRSGRVELSALGVPMLGTAPVTRSRSASKGSSSKLFPVDTSGGDAYRRLHGILLFNLDSGDKTVVLVAGVKKASAASTVAANIGATAARAGRRTLIIGADLRNDQLGHHFGMSSDAPGLSDVILDGSSLAESIRTVDDVDNLGLLSAGTRLQNPTEVLQSEAFGRLMSAVQADYDLVIVEAPPVLKVADAVDAAGFCDGSIVVAERGSDSRQAIADSVDQLRSVGSDIVGVVVADGK